MYVNGSDIWESGLIDLMFDELFMYEWSWVKNYKLLSFWIADTNFCVVNCFSRADGDYGAAKVMLRPASPGTGVIAGGSVRIVLEMAGVDNALGKQLGSNNALNNARATVAAVQKMKQFREVAEERGIPMEELWK